MPKNKVNKSYMLFSIHLPIILLAALIVIGGYQFSKRLTNNNDSGTVLSNKTKEKDNSGKSESSNKGNADTPTISNNSSNNENSNSGKSEANKSKNEDKSDKVNSSSKADKSKDEKKSNKDDKSEKEDKPKTTTISKGKAIVAEKLKEVAEDEAETGNLQASEEIEDVVEVIEETNGEAEEVIDELESRPKWKTFLVGTDYKNLGQLRSTIVRNRNTIRTLTKAAEKVQGEDNQLMIQEQLQIMEQEQQVLKSIIEEHEEGFSILGWVFRFLSGYDDDAPIDDGGAGPMDDGDTDESSESTESTESAQ